MCPSTGRSPEARDHRQPVARDERVDQRDPIAERHREQRRAPQLAARRRRRPRRRPSRPGRRAARPGCRSSSAAHGQRQAVRAPGGGPGRVQRAGPAPVAHWRLPLPAAPGRRCRRPRPRARSGLAASGVRAAAAAETPAASVPVTTQVGCPVGPRGRGDQSGARAQRADRAAARVEQLQRARRRRR